MKKHHSIPAIHPGEILREDILPALAMTKTDLAKSLGVSRQSVHAILSEKQDVTAEMAVRLGKLLGNGGRFWTSLQCNYDLELAEQRIDVTGMTTLAR